jgi:putative hydrolase of the HAD superfamily
MSGIRAVLFDLDDTLFAHRAASEAGFLEHVRTLGHPYDLSDPASELGAWRGLEQKHYDRYLAGDIGFEDQRRIRVREYAARHGVALTPAEAGEWFASYSARYADGWRLHDDALACLDALRSRVPGLKIGLITNGERDFQLRKVDAVGLTNEVDDVVASGEVGITKPDARIFELACERLGVRQAEAVYVGDRLSTDALGAARAGLTGVWLDRYDATISETEREAAASLGVVRITTLERLPIALGL